MTAIGAFFKNDFWPNRGRVLRHSNFWCSLLLGFLLAMFWDFPLHTGNLGHIIYAIIAIGFTALVLPLTVLAVDRDFIYWVATAAAPGEKPPTPDRFKRLLFVFVWSGMVHVMLLFYALAVTCLFTETGNVITHFAATPLGHVLISGFYLWLVFYSLMQLFASVLSAYRLGERYADWTQLVHNAEDLLIEMSFRKGRAYAAYVRLPNTKGLQITRTREHSPNVMVDYTHDDRPVGIEILEPFPPDFERLKQLFDELSITNTNEGRFKIHDE